MRGFPNEVACQDLSPLPAAGPKSSAAADDEASSPCVLRVLKAAPLAQLAEEIKRARSMSELGQVIVNSGKVEVDYIEAVKGASESAFLQEREQEQLPQIPSTPQSPLPSADPVSRIGPPDNHLWRKGITRHKLRG
jgi:hypothetical protein